MIVTCKHVYSFLMIESILNLGFGYGHSERGKFFLNYKIIYVKKTKQD